MNILFETVQISL